MLDIRWIRDNPQALEWGVAGGLLLAAVSLTATTAVAGGRPDLVQLGLQQQRPYASGELLVQFMPGTRAQQKLAALKAIGGSRAELVAIAASVVAPIAVLMGFAFPLGMSAFGEENRAWFWAVNGAVSVLASVSRHS